MQQPNPPNDNTPESTQFGLMRKQSFERTRAIWAYVSQHSPTRIRAIARATGLARTVVVYHLTKLRQLGYVTWTPKRARTIRAKVKLLPLPQRSHV